MGALLVTSTHCLMSNFLHTASGHVTALRATSTIPRMMLELSADDELAEVQG